mmetsp:Transcript_124761/g.399744  ORF Transcript_124761/g.399744 Transcript_124761/m.399744 type:complete len:230 (-) Transcript_124761:1602-2291(-)
MAPIASAVALWGNRRQASRPRQLNAVAPASRRALRLGAVHRLFLGLRVLPGRLAAPRGGAPGGAAEGAAAPRAAQAAARGKVPATDALHEHLLLSADGGTAAAVADSGGAADTDAGAVDGAETRRDGEVVSMLYLWGQAEAAAGRRAGGHRGRAARWHLQHKLRGYLGERGGAVHLRQAPWRGHDLSAPHRRMQQLRGDLCRAGIDDRCHHTCPPEEGRVPLAEDSGWP